MLDKLEATNLLGDLVKVRQAEREKLDVIHDYWHGLQPLPVVPSGLPTEVRRLAEMSRVNMLSLIVDVLNQSLFVSGYRAVRAADDAPAWGIWQANKMDARQTGIHRAALAYGTSYAMVLPGDTSPVIRGASPRRLTAVYGQDDSWPRYALEVTRDGRSCSYRLFDDEAVYRFESESTMFGLDPAAELVEVAPHGMGVCPVVRYRNTEDLDGGSHGEIERLIPLQVQIDFLTFDQLVAAHYGAFRQRYILGWLAPDENERLKVSASRMLTLEDPDVKVGSFEATQLGDYLNSRQASIEQLATISQTPPHHLLGKLVNLSAEGIAASESGQRRKIAEKEVLFGESHEQVLALAGQLAGIEPDDTAQVRWRDTEARSLSQVADALGKLSQMLQIPPQELWDRIPNTSDADIQRWREAAKSSDSIANLTDLLTKQATATDVANP